MAAAFFCAVIAGSEVVAEDGDAVPVLIELRGPGTRPPPVVLRRAAVDGQMDRDMRGGTRPRRVDVLLRVERREPDPLGRVEELGVNLLPAQPRTLEHPDDLRRGTPAAGVPDWRRSCRSSGRSSPRRRSACRIGDPPRRRRDQRLRDRCRPAGPASPCSRSLRPAASTPARRPRSCRRSARGPAPAPRRIRQTAYAPFGQTTRRFDDSNRGRLPGGAMASRPLGPSTITSRMSAAVGAIRQPSRMVPSSTRRWIQQPRPASCRPRGRRRTPRPASRPPAAAGWPCPRVLPALAGRQAARAALGVPIIDGRINRRCGQAGGLGHGAGLGVAAVGELLAGQVEPLLAQVGIDQARAAPLASRSPAMSLARVRCSAR